MQRGVLAVAAATIVCGGCFLVLRSIAASGYDVADVVLLTAAAALVLTATATLFSIRANLLANRTAGEVVRLARSVDSAITEMTGRSERDVADLRELGARLSREVEVLMAADRIADRAPSRAKAAEPPAPSIAPARDNIVSLRNPKTDRPEEDASASASKARAKASNFELPVQRAFAADALELSLQPVVSISMGSATGFDVFAHFEREDGTSFDLRRLPSPLPNVSQAGFERWLIAGAVDAVRRQRGFVGEDMPFYAQVSEALLGDDVELQRLLRAFADAPDAIRDVVLTLPGTILEKPGRYAEALGLIDEAGLRVAADGTTGSRDGLARLSREGATCLRLPADRLLGRVKHGRSAAPARLIEMAESFDLPIVAVDVATDEDAVTLIDLGVGLMTGERFSGPRKLRSGDVQDARDRAASS
jgi:cyclic-di-GMP phosphodiesterase TipF (flagellum assembly factor)